MIDIKFLRHLDRLSLIINKRMTSNYIGEREAVYGGQGLVFKDHAQYSIGDDFRRIDWKAFARTDKLFVKRFEEDRNLIVHIILDFSSSMDFGTKKISKADFASMFGLGFAYMALKNNEKFVLSTFADKLELFRPRKGKNQLMAILDYLNKKNPKGKSNFELALAEYKKLVKSRSLIVIISDFLYDPEQVRHGLLRFKGHDIILIQVLDVIEKDLKDVEGDFKLVDSESKGILRTFISPFGRKKYLEKIAAHRAHLKRIASEIGANFFSFGTDHQIFDAFHEVLSKK
ncbi:DUF58 domain-containing protein [Candidatus Woesearchaeota archaeon]|nr:DUF58 domain-containing protein [Candidatus Woesearchaeota archaeon]